MAKRILWVSGAVLIITVGTLAYLFVAQFLIGIYDGVRLSLSVLLLLTSILLFRRTNEAARLLMLMGSASLVAAYLHDFVIIFGMRHQLFARGPDALVFVGLMEARENPLLAVPADIVRFLGLCFPAGLLLLALRRAPQPI